MYQFCLIEKPALAPYRVERAKDNPDEIISDPNRADDPDYILRLIGQIVTVSVETVKIVRRLPDLGI